MSQKKLFLLSSGPTGGIVLTVREIECSYYLIKGLSSREIAVKIFLSPRTVDYYIENVKGKFGCSRRTELVAKLLAGGFPCAKLSASL